MRSPLGWLAVVSATVLVLAGVAAAAMSARVEVLGVESGELTVLVRVEDAFGPRLREGLRRGMPATLAYHVELWRRRGAWFDRMEGAWNGEMRVRYDVWSDRFRLERGRSPAFLTADLESLGVEVERPLRVRLLPASRLRPGVAYYVSFSATLKPLTVEDARAVEGWLSGEVQNKRRAGLGAITGLPFALFDAVRNLVGLGDESARADSPDFTVEDVEDLE